MSSALWDTLTNSQWLLGALISVFASLLACLGLVMQKKAQYEFMKERSINIEGRRILKECTWNKLVGSKMFWQGFFVYAISMPLKLVALIFAPETTVQPLGAFEVLFNLFFSYGYLAERFTRVDLKASICGIVCIVICNAMQPNMEPGYLIDFPVHKLLKFESSLWSNVGFMAFMLAWLILVLLSLFLISWSSTKQFMKPFTWPVLIGLLLSQFLFMSKISTTLFFQALHGQDQVWGNYSTYIALLLTFALWVAHVIAVCEGLRQLACRYFVPACWVTTAILSMIEFNLYFKVWKQMHNYEITIFVIFISLCGICVMYITSAHKVILHQDTGAQSPLLKPDDNVLEWHERVLAIMEEYHVKKPDAKNPKELSVIDMTVPYHARNRYMPLVYCFTVICIPLSLFLCGKAFGAFVFLTIFTAYQSWKMGGQIALFSYVGIKKMAHYESADFEKLFVEEKRHRRANKLPATNFIEWGDVKHFVILPNYKEAPEIMRLAISTIAKSGIAKQSICLVLAMEQREKGSDEKASSLLDEFRSCFWDVTATYHPPNLEGETPGKSSNTRWAAQKVLESLESRGLKRDLCVLTVADADSEFHPEYFAAVTYHFIHQGGAEGETPDRYLTIWQAPMLHYKNYLTQPAAVRLASVISTTHELANLADPTATKAPYSTYSISATLAEGVDGWDPDWISEDWHMNIKCFLATGGRARVVPIFLGVINYAPEDEGWWGTIQARWVQAKRHALGFSEIVFMQDHLPRVLRALPKSERFRFVSCYFFTWLKLLMIHVVLAVLFFIGPFNGYLINYFAQNSIADELDINSWTFLVNCILQALSIVGFIGVFIDSVLIYEKISDRIIGATVFKDGEIVPNPQLSIAWRSRILHVLTTLPTFLVLCPLIFAGAMVTEWIAAYKSSKTHKFKYEVALKAPVPTTA